MTAGAGLVLHLARFGRALRRGGAAVTLSDEADALAALVLVDLGDRDEVRRALATALKIRPRDRALFAELFATLWSAAAAARDSGTDDAGSAVAPPPITPAPPAGPPPQSFVDPTKPPAAPPDGRPGQARGAARPAAATLVGEEAAAAELLIDGEEPGYSPEAALRRKPFEECTAAEQEAMEELIARLAQRLATRRSRRRVPVRGRGEPDLRRSLRRAATAHGGELLELARRARPIEEPHLVVLCDTSGSMDPHARFLLAFVLGLRQAARRSEVFAFNTSLVRLTGWLRAGAGGSGRGGCEPGGTAAMLDRLGREVPDWSGGTRIGECLGEFADRHLDLVNGRSVVLVLSDGLDRGDVAPLAGALCAVRARARRVLWLNPLAGDARYEPTARAMAAALPYLDRLLPAHNLESLERLLPFLAA